MSFRTPSFRNRLSFFFVVIVIVPMISVAIVLFRLISDNQTGKATAAIAATAQAASAIYTQDAASPGAALVAANIARDPVLGRALQNADVMLALARAHQLLVDGGVVRISLLQGSEVVFDVGDPSAVAPVIRDIVDAQGRPLGRLEVSLTTAAQYRPAGARITMLDVVVHEGPECSLPRCRGCNVAALPPPMGANVQKVGRVAYRAVTLPAVGFAGRPSRSRC